MNKKEVEDLLKRGAYGAVMDDDNAADQFCEEDIDAILQRRTQVIQIQSEGKGSTFSKVLNNSLSYIVNVENVRLMLQQCKRDNVHKMPVKCEQRKCIVLNHLFSISTWSC